MSTRYGRHSGGPYRARISRHSGSRGPHPRNPCGGRIALVLIVVCAIVVCVAAFFLMRSCSSGGVQTQGVQTPAYESPYDFSGLSQENGRFIYREGGVICSKTGIDVSEHAGDIDWEAVAGDGIDFAVIRLGNRGTTEGGLYLDQRYRENIEGATAAGIPVGVYFFSQATNEDEAREEADFVIENLSGVSLSYPVVFDEEVVGTDSRTRNLTHAQLTANARAFADRIRESGLPVMIYGNASDISRLNLEDLSDIPIWYAQYQADEPQGQFDFCIWQYTENGTVAGIDGGVDLDLQFTSPAGNEMMDKA